MKSGPFQGIRMVLFAFILGFICGISILPLRTLLKNGFALSLSEDEKYLLSAARAANGRLILKQDQGTSGTPIILLKEFPNPRRIEAAGLIEKMVARKLIQLDISGVPGRYTLTSVGWARSQKLPDFPLQPIRPGSWFDSISRKPPRIGRR